MDLGELLVKNGFAARKVLEWEVETGVSLKQDGKGGRFDEEDAIISQGV